VHLTPITYKSFFKAVFLTMALAAFGFTDISDSYNIMRNNAGRRLYHRPADEIS